MKNKLFFVLMIGTINISAQGINFERNNGLEENFYLPSVKSISFVSNEIVLKFQNNSNYFFVADSLRLFNFTANSPLTIDEFVCFDSKNISLFPNPCRTILNINSKVNLENNIEITICDSKGEIVKTKDIRLINANWIELDVSNLMANQYLIKLTMNGSIILTKSFFKF
jgi:hypothetical protein